MSYLIFFKRGPRSIPSEEKVTGLSTFVLPTENDGGFGPGGGTSLMDMEEGRKLAISDLERVRRPSNIAIPIFRGGIIESFTSGIINHAQCGGSITIV